MDDRRLPHKIENKIKIKCAISSGWLLPYPSNALPFLFLRASLIPSAFFQLTGLLFVPLSVLYTAASFVPELSRDG
jgi:hypothetical protein